MAEASEPQILAHPPAGPAGAMSVPVPIRVRRGPSPAQWLALVVLSLPVVAAFGLAPDTTLETVPTRTVQRALPLPVIAIDDAPAVYWREERVQRGDTIGSLLARAGVDDPAAMQFLRTDPAARPLYQLRPGRPVRVAVDDAQALVALRFHANSGEMLAIERAGDDGFRALARPATEDVRTAMRSGEIRSSLFGAADTAGIPDSVTVALADVFGGEIDFYHDLRRGDRFSVVYEERFVDGEPVGTGRILAAEFENRGRTLRAFLWRHADGEEGYYTENGRSARSAFLRSPMEFSRITSGFTLARFHPILQQWRAHQGVDYGAPTGTPVRATADGLVTFAGQQGGYGNVIFLRHQGTYSTVYGHLSRFAPLVRTGTRVRQGDTIGYVGMTGWATGPHLHYEFRVADEARNPLTLALPTAQPIGPEALPRFQATIASLAETLALARSLPGGALAARR